MERVINVAIEVFKIDRQTKSGNIIRINKLKRVFFNQIGLNWEENCYNNIETRVDKMINAGLVDEVKNILDMGYPRTLNALNTVGYKEIIKYLDNQITFDRAIELIKRNTRHYAKRQMTWF